MKGDIGMAQSKRMKGTEVQTLGEVRMRNTA